MTRRSARGQYGLWNEIVVDNFAGGGGASIGIERALGRPADLAINHDRLALAMHEANHPYTRHVHEDLWSVDPREATGGRPVGLAWFSPDCTHFSRAKGTKPLKKRIRGLAWIVLRWAARAHPRVIVLENVEEFETWGPLRNGRPCPQRRGSTFRAWVEQLRDLGYAVDWRSLQACDHGAPTTRRRLYLIARRDGQPIAWPEPTHGPGRPEPYRVAADCIEWGLDCPSIFERRRPLAEATLRRIARGLERFVVGAREPFIVRHGHYSTRTGAGMIEGRGAGTFRGQPLTEPLGTVCATNDKNLVVPALEAAFVAKHYGGVTGHGLRRPLGTVTARDHHALVAAFLTKFYGTSTGSGADRPLPTVTARGNHLAEVRAFLTAYYSGGGTAQAADEPLHTVTSKARFGLVTVEGRAYEIADVGMRMLVPRELFTAQGFPSSYRIDVEANGRPLTKAQQTALVGNSVCPDVAERVVAENVALREFAEVSARRRETA